MSIAIAIAANDTVLLVAAGPRLSIHPAGTGRVEKIVTLGDTLAVIEFGDETSARAALAQVRQATTATATARTITDTIVESVAQHGLSGTQVGLVVGGVDTQGAWVGGAMFGPGMAAPATDLTRPRPGELEFVVLGGEPAGAKAHFADMARRAMNAAGNDHAGLLVMLQRAAKKTVQYAAARDPASGERAQFVLLAKGQAARAGYL
jgi:hypothetical protein